MSIWRKKIKDWENYISSLLQKYYEYERSLTPALLSDSLDPAMFNCKGNITCFSCLYLMCSAGAIDPSYLLEQIELQISEAKEEAFSRKEILERVEKWKAACEEECWLEEYNRVSWNNYWSP